MITSTRELNFLWEGVSIPVKIDRCSRGFYAVVDSTKWESVQMDDLCSSALAMIEFLLENGFELSGKWQGYVDTDCTPVFWLKGE